MLAADNYAGHSTFPALHCHMTIVILRRQMVKGYEKANFVFYSM